MSMSNIHHIFQCWHIIFTWLTLSSQKLVFAIIGLLLVLPHVCVTALHSLSDFIL